MAAIRDDFERHRRRTRVLLSTRKSLPELVHDTSREFSQQRLDINPEGDTRFCSRQPRLFPGDWCLCGTGLRTPSALDTASEIAPEWTHSRSGVCRRTVVMVVRRARATSNMSRSGLCGLPGEQGGRAGGSWYGEERCEWNCGNEISGIRSDAKYWGAARPKVIVIVYVCLSPPKSSFQRFRR